MKNAPAQPLSVVISLLLRIMQNVRSDYIVMDRNVYSYRGIHEHSFCCLPFGPLRLVHHGCRHVSDHAEFFFCSSMEAMSELGRLSQHSTLRRNKLAARDRLLWLQIFGLKLLSFFPKSVTYS